MVKLNNSYLSLVSLRFYRSKKIWLAMPKCILDIARCKKRLKTPALSVPLIYFIDLSFE